MKRKNNVETIQQSHQNFNRHDIDSAVKDVADNFTYTDHARGITTNNRQEFFDLLEGWKEAFSDAHIAETTYIDGGKKVATIFRGRGTNDGLFGDYPSTGKSVDVPMCEVVRFSDDGTLMSGELYFDRITMMAQLGHIEEPAGQ